MTDNQNGEVLGGRDDLGSTLYETPLHARDCTTNGHRDDQGRLCAESEDARVGQVTLGSTLVVPAANLRTPNAPDLLVGCLQLGIDLADTPAEFRAFLNQIAPLAETLPDDQRSGLRAAANARRQALRGEAP